MSRMPGGVDLILFLCSAYCPFLDLASDGGISAVLNLIDDPGGLSVPLLASYVPKKGESPALLSPARLSETVQR